MDGLQMMLSRMFGMTPEEMRGGVQDVMKAIVTGAEDLQEIKSRLTRIEIYLGIELQPAITDGVELNGQRGKQSNGNS